MWTGLPPRGQASSWRTEPRGEARLELLSSFLSGRWPRPPSQEHKAGPRAGRTLHWAPRPRVPGAPRLSEEGDSRHREKEGRRRGKGDLSIGIQTQTREDHGSHLSPGPAETSWGVSLWGD